MQAFSRNNAVKETTGERRSAELLADKRLEAVLQCLQAALRVPLWLWIEEDGWRRVTTQSEAAEETDWWSESPLPSLLEHAEARVARLLHQHVREGLKPQTASLGDDWHLLAVPIATRAGRVAITLAMQIEAPGILRELASLALIRAEHEAQIEQLHGEFDVYTAQITDDFEELSFLRNIAQQLQSSDLTNDLVDLAQGVLPMLRTSIKAQTVVLMLPGSAEFGTVRRSELVHAAFGDPAVWCGPRKIQESTCRLIVCRFQRPGELGAVVKNLWNSPEEAKLLPGVESFILAPITKSGVHMGWLLALNRGYRPGFEDATFLSHMPHHEFGTAEAGLVASAASMLASQGRNFELYREREELLIKVVRALVNAIEAKDTYTCGHSERVALYGRALAKEIGLETDDCDRIYLAGLLHDIGKIGVSDKTLHKPGRLTPEEFEEVKKHPDKGWSILNDLDQLRYVLPGVVHHHERIDGAGYPDGLAGDAIPLDGRILAVADAYDAMTSNRPYRDGMPVEKAYSILNEGAGTQWDARLIEAFNRIRPAILHIQNSYQRPAAARRAESMLAGV
jgi:HD-GYP domain-containing protein (c-di-GMP phosphodiesterase class II)